MDVVMLSRLQFAVATLFHFIFVPLTLGLAFVIAIMETLYVRRGDEGYREMAKFWGRLFIINFALGVVTGITLEFQFGTNWSRYSEYVGDIFGSLLAIEATVAFFIESTFIAVWIFGWDKLSARAHAFVMWLVAIGSTVSAFWILLANGFMQRPVGYVIDSASGKPVLDSFSELVLNKFALMEFFHTISAAWLLSGFFVLGISSYHILKNKNSPPFLKSFRIALYIALAGAFLTVFSGHLSGEEVAYEQPAKLAAMESHWETVSNAPMYILLIPDEKNERNLVQALAIPGGLSLLAFFDPNATVQGLLDFPPDERPPVTITYIAFRGMVGLGFLFMFATVVAFVRRNKLEETKPLLWFFLFAIPLPFIATELGWIVTEVGRQPWIVHGLLKTTDAVSPIRQAQVGISLAGFILVYSLLFLAYMFLIIKFARLGIASDGEPESGGEVSHA